MTKKGRDRMEKTGTQRFALDEEQGESKKPKKSTRIPCQRCGATTTKVDQTFPAFQNPLVEREWIRRRRHRCESCNATFVTDEKYRA